jgi:hypothetical protein
VRDGSQVRIGNTTMTVRILEEGDEDDGLPFIDGVGGAGGAGV